MDLFEAGKLKDQKINFSKLLSKPDFKQHYITPIRGLPEKDQCALLHKIIEREISLSELKEHSATLKSMATLKTAFVKITNSESWDKAVELFPNYASEINLKRFLGCDLKKTIPKLFYDYCHKAKTNEVGGDHESQSVLNFGSSDGPPITAVLITGSITSISGANIQNKCPSFSGADLAIISIDEVSIYIHTY